MPTEKIKRLDIKGPRLSNLSIPYKRIPIALGSVLAGCNCALGPNDVFYHQTGPPIPSSLLPWPLHPSSSGCLNSIQLPSAFLPSLLPSPTNDIHIINFETRFIPGAQVKIEICRYLYIQRAWPRLSRWLRLSQLSRLSHKSHDLRNEFD